MKNTFAPNSFFDLSDFQFADLLQKETHIWDVIKNIAPYIASLFADGKIKGNYAENVYVDPQATVDQTARVIGPTIICSGARVDFNAYIHGNVILDKNSVVGPGSEIKNSVLLNTCKASHLNYVSDSFLGNQVRLGAGAVITNRRLDRQNIMLGLDTKQKVDTGLTRFGAIIGDGSRIGANSVINPGTILSKNTKVFPLTSVFGTHLTEETIK